MLLSEVEVQNLHQPVTTSTVGDIAAFHLSKDQLVEVVKHLDSLCANLAAGMMEIINDVEMTMEGRCDVLRMRLKNESEMQDGWFE